MKARIVAGALALGLWASAWAEPTTGRVNVTAVRPYQQDRAIVETTSTGFCLDASGRDTTAFMIDLSTPAGRGMYVVVAKALVTGLPVALEIWDASCQGWPDSRFPWGTQLRSVSLLLPAAEEERGRDRKLHPWRIYKVVIFLVDSRVSGEEGACVEHERSSSCTS